MVRGSRCKIICRHIWLLWQTVHKAGVWSQVSRKSGCCWLAADGVTVWGSRRQFLTTLPGFSGLTLGPLQRLLMPAQGTGFLPFLKARELLHEKASIVSPSIRLPSILQHKKTSVHFHSTELATAGKPRAWREQGLVGTAAAPAGSGAAFRPLRGQCQLCCNASQGAWLQGIPRLSQAMNPKGHRQLCYERACGKKRISLCWEVVGMASARCWCPVDQSYIRVSSLAEVSPSCEVLS